jgi:hypothetical protein
MPRAHSPPGFRQLHPTLMQVPPVLAFNQRGPRRRGKIPRQRPPPAGSISQRQMFSDFTGMLSPLTGARATDGLNLERIMRGSKMCIKTATQPQRSANRHQIFYHPTRVRRSDCLHQPGAPLISAVATYDASIRPLPRRWSIPERASHTHRRSAKRSHGDPRN